MRVTELAGYLVEVQDPAFVRGDNPVAACIAAVEDWLSRPPERLTTREERIGRELLSELLHPTGRAIPAGK